MYHIRCYQVFNLLIYECLPRKAYFICMNFRGILSHSLRMNFIYICSKFTYHLIMLSFLFFFRNMTTPRTISRKQILKKILNKKYLATFQPKEKNYIIVVTDDDLVSRRFDYVIRIPDDIPPGNKIEESILRSLHFYNGNIKNYFDTLKYIFGCLYFANIFSFFFSNI